MVSFLTRILPSLSGGSLLQPPKASASSDIQKYTPLNNQPLEHEAGVASANEAFGAISLDNEV